MVVLFDLDDTLVDHGSAFREATRTLCDSLASPVPFVQFAATWAASHGRQYDRYLAGELSYDEQRFARVIEAAATSATRNRTREPCVARLTFTCFARAGDVGHGLLSCAVDRVAALWPVLHVARDLVVESDGGCVPVSRCRQLDGVARPPAPLPNQSGMKTMPSGSSPAGIVRATTPRTMSITDMVSSAMFAT